MVLNFVSLESDRDSIETYFVNVLIFFCFFFKSHFVSAAANLGVCNARVCHTLSLFGT